MARRRLQGQRFGVVERFSKLKMDAFRVSLQQSAALVTLNNEPIT